MSSCCWLTSACVAIVVLQLIKRIVPWLYKNIIGPKFYGPKVDVREMGKWAVVTGATDGIGKSYAKALAQKGLNLILISRSKDKLKSVADEIKSKSSVQIKTVDVDFTQGPEIYEKIAKEIAGLEVGTLVNNVGMCYEYPEYFLSVADSDKFFRDLITCNIHSVTFMSKLVLPAMVERKKGLIINISSMSAQMPCPFMTVYAATKAFVDKFSSDLGAEYKKDGIIVQCVLPGLVATKMATSIDTDSFGAPNSDTFVASALQTIGITTRTNGYLVHSLMIFAMHAVKAVTCEPASIKLATKVLLDVRKRALNLRKTQ